MLRAKFFPDHPREMCNAMSVMGPAADDYPHPHLLGIEGLTPGEITLILDRAQHYAEKNRSADKTSNILAGATVVNLFYENSTRTLTSFELAAKRLGAAVINMTVGTSSVKKGETLIDTAMTLNAMNPDALVVRHADSGAVKLLSEKVNCAVLNAGDGRHEHPTQALLDALTIRRHKGRLHRLNVAICGDIAHSRVARSNILLLNTMGSRVRLVAPPTLIPSKIERMGVEIFHDMEEGLKDCDIVMMLRLQLERMEGSFIPSVREYFHFHGLDRAKLANAKPDALIMHPGPMNRGVEIDSEVADDVERSVIREQVEMGVAVRMAALELLVQNHRKMGGMA
ncbi:aspartate carbamoyltransferase catalytic subunit [Thalassospira profundimaris]|uniref:Aspartate carbamoyltransferase n=3 Tax=Thalassospiraceae TaxID=2844866 RepID=A0A367W5G6_9PROT|nr:aspartate carbamoyltransferase catalytic subunit [Thalassospira profundimaris]